MAIRIFRMKAGNRVNRRVSGDIGVTLFLVIFAIIMVIPLYFAIIQSIKPMNELYIFPPRLYVTSPTPDNYADLFRLMSSSWVPFSRYVFNTVMITAVGTFGHIILASMAAYPLAKYRFPFSQGFAKMVRFALMFTATVLTIPTYIIMARLGWIADYNDPITYLELMVTGQSNNYGVFSNPDYDALIVKAKATLPGEERDAILKDFMERLRK